MRRGPENTGLPAAFESGSRVSRASSHMLRASCSCMGMACLVEKLGIVNAERFIATIKRENFDYTTWQREYFAQILISSRRRIVKSNAESGIGYTDILIVILSEKVG